ncbi:Mitochodrial transcription termination factor-related protein [Corchorus olitorius]|uniref:Mitochodrial transcription termination factor-related protein n=1 Tax=Corchorus olitorius TaxID=93759 RepID=A0A1R3GZ89_9ROSI|nr:Mitochodrial transcription termination factor-related protein [Corchorus olitorius]
MLLPSLQLLTPKTPTPHYIKFRTSHRENIRYLKAVGIIDPTVKPRNLPSPQTVDQVLATVNFLKSKGIHDQDFSRLAFLCPQLFSTNFDASEIEPVFDFLIADLHASVEESRGLIVHCPQILFSDVEYCLRPTLEYLRKLGVEKLNEPSKQKAFLLNTRVEKLRAKLRFLRSIGLNYEEAASFCARMPAIFGYNIDDNLMPKFEFLVNEMERSLEELKEFPQYFAFSLHKRIEPRHWHLKQRNVRIKLNRMLLWSDERFYTKWK